MRIVPALLLLLPLAPGPVAPSAQTGASSTERVTLDVRVADALGRPVVSLTANDLSVEIDGRPQPVVSATYVNFSTSDSAMDSVAAGRSVLVVVDDLSFDEAPAAAWRDGLAAWLTALPARDRVGVRSTSGRISGVDIGADRAAVMAALGQAFRARVVPGPPRSVSFREALAPRVGVASGELESARDSLERTAIAQVNALQTAVTDMLEADGTRVVIVVSRGLAPVGVTDHATALRRAVGHAGVSLFAVMPHDSAPLPAAPATDAPEADNTRLLQEGLEQVILGAGGRLLRSGAQPSDAWAVVTATVSGAYRLVLDVPTTTSTKPNLGVRVTARNATLAVNAASRIVVPDLVGDPATVAAQVVTALRDGEPAVGLDLESASVVSRDEAGRMQLLTSVSAAASATPPLTLTFVVLDELGAEVRGGTTRVGDPVDGMFRATFPVVLTDGRYRLRFAVVDAAGRVGTVERKVLARPSRVDDYLVDDPLVMWRGESPSWLLAGATGIPLSARAVAVTWALTAATRDAPAPVVSLSLAESDGRPTATVALTPSQTDTGWRVQSELNIDSLRGGGPYTLVLSAGRSRETARVLAGGVLTMARPATAVAAAVVRPTREAFLAALQSDVRAAWPRFDVKTILTTPLMRQLMEDFAADARRPLPAALAGSLTDERWRANLAQAAAARDPFAAIARAFLALDAGAPDAALDALVDVSKTQSGSAALLLVRGAAHAAAGRDAEAIAAWQAVLGPASADPFWGALLVDALGRAGDFSAASEALSLLSTGPSSAAALRVIDVSIVLGQFDRARAAADRAAPTGGAVGARAGFYRVVLAYADALADTPAARERFLSLATAYADAGGEEAGLMRSWIATLQP